MWSLSTIRFIGQNGHVTGVEVEDVRWERTNGCFSMNTIQDTRKIINTDFVLLAMGFVHPVIDGLLTELGIELDQKSNIRVNNNLMTSSRKIFAAGDAVNGASLVVNAIASGRRAAKEIDRFLKGA
jgi:glutamate synthase (NADPH/NADH) small chain